MLGVCALLWGCGGGGGEDNETSGDSDSGNAPASVPAAPRDLVAVAGTAQVVLTWSSVPIATAHNLYLASESGLSPANYTTLADGARVADVPNPATVTGLDDGTLYHFVVTALNAAGESSASNEAQAAPLPPPSNNANLAGLMLSVGVLTPAFDPAVTDYATSVSFATDRVIVTPASEDDTATLRVNGALVGSGLPSAPVPLGEGANVIDVAVTAADGRARRTYSVVVTRQSAGNFAQQAFVKASNTAPGDAFGHAVALSGDTLVVGAPLEDGDGTDEADDSAENAGAVYVFVRDNDTWRQQAYLKAANAGTFDEFGYSVAVSGDTLAVGARNEASAVTGIDGNPLNNSATGAGAVYVFVRDTGSWTRQSYIKASNTGAGDAFGTSLVLDGDTLAVGAPLEDSAASTVDGQQLNDDAASAGAVYVFTRDGLGSWSQQAYVKASNADENDRFGYALALSGDTLAVGAYNEDSLSAGVDGDQGNDTGRDAGAAYVFVRDGAGRWTQQAYLKASNPGLDDHFGAGLALDGDTLAVGARYEDSAADTIDGDQQNDDAFNAGAVYVFVRDASALWAQEAYLKAANGGTPDRFGWSLALAADTLVAGAPLEAGAATGVNGGGDDSAAAAGAAHAFIRTASWSQTAYIKASNTGEGDELGFAVTISGDTIAAGAPTEDGSGRGIDPGSDENAEDAGAVYVYVRD